MKESRKILFKKKIVWKRIVLVKSDPTYATAKKSIWSYYFQSQISAKMVGMGKIYKISRKMS